MKSLLLVAGLAAVSFTAPAFAFSPKSTAPIVAPAPRVLADSVVKPVDLPLSFAGGTINIEFSLDGAGKPCDILVHSVSDAALKKQLTKAFSQWRFETPAPTGKSTGAPQRFVLPLAVTPEV